MPLSPSGHVALTADTLVRRVGEESVILNVRTGRYYTLDEVGTRVLEHLTSGASVGEAIEALLAEFAVERATLEADVESLLGELAAAGLAEAR